MKYSLPTTKMSKQEYVNVLKPEIPSITHSLALPKTTPTEVILFPRRYGGYDIKDIWIWHLAEMTKYFVQHSRNKNSLGRRILILLSEHQLEVGTYKTL